MVIVMDMSMGKTEKLSAAEAAAEEFGAFVDEVLNAGWLLQPASEAGLRFEVHAHDDAAASPAAAIEPDEFLRNLYRNQE
jgi:imidazolonepropionase-like amidohydrolase